NRSAAGRAAGQQGRAQADPTTYHSSCTNKPRPSSGTHRRLTASRNFHGLFLACNGYTPTRLPEQISRRKSHLPWADCLFCACLSPVFDRAGSRIFGPDPEISRTLIGV